MRPHLHLLPLLLPLATAEILGTFTILTLARPCTWDGTSCTYALTLDVAYQQPTSDNDKDKNTKNSDSDAPTTCAFTITTAPGTTALANQTDFQNQPCGRRPGSGSGSGSGSGRAFLVNGGWDAAGSGFVTLVVTDVAAEAYAFFGYGDAELAGGAVESWYGRPCGSSFTISWGYSRATDSAVMTVCYPANGTDAWFGFERKKKNSGSRNNGDSAPSYQPGEGAAECPCCPRWFEVAQKPRRGA
ncbi:hypothetical protein BT67DRAFT_432131 [Trichocladium antarcticum]|uniref:Uncharacterized protein n=1 Tax=Trichocladium antarcticum TaxID=1450529 RepID=A0AAN6URQ8_9PEZI|nr:hypothetical protein BT67DRAFT_432131 [Trichocladium antarcticum]